MSLSYPYGFVYEVTCISNGRKYIGSHRRTQNPDDPDDSWYIGSSTNQEFWDDLELYGRDKFVREILEDVYEEDREILLERERVYLLSREVRDNPLYYNSTVSQYGGGATLGKKLMTKGDECHYFSVDEISTMLKEGWVLGTTEKNKLSNSRAQTGRVLTKSVRDKISKSLHLNNPMYIEENRGKVSKSKIGKIWVHKGDSQTYISEYDLEYYLSIGYELGMITRSGVHSVSKDFNRVCGICGKTYLGGRYSIRCPECYSSIRSNIMKGVHRNEE